MFMQLQKNPTFGAISQLVCDHGFEGIDEELEEFLVLQHRHVWVIKIIERFSREEFIIRDGI